jgi:hypothetical protein
MSDGVNPSSIEEQREDRAGRTDEKAPTSSDEGVLEPSTTPDETEPAALDTYDPGAADQPAEGGREQAEEAEGVEPNEEGGEPDEEGSEDFGSRPG